MSLNSTKNSTKTWKKLLFPFVSLLVGVLLFCFVKVVGFFKQGNGVVRILLTSTPTFVFSLVSIVFRGLTFPWNPNLNMNWRNPKPWGERERERFRSIKYNNGMRWFSNMNRKILCLWHTILDRHTIKKGQLEFVASPLATPPIRAHYHACGRCHSINPPWPPSVPPPSGPICTSLHLISTFVSTLFTLYLYTALATLTQYLSNNLFN